jgi:hypothetical protein
MFFYVVTLLATYLCWAVVRRAVARQRSKPDRPPASTDGENQN